MSKSKKIIDITEKFSARNYNPLPVVVSDAKGVWVEDLDGNKYMDMLSAYSAVSQGHCHPKVIAALKEQAEMVTLTSRAFKMIRWDPFVKSWHSLPVKIWCFP